MKRKADTAGRIEIQKDGPYLVTGTLPLETMTIGTNRAGESVRWEKGPALPAGETYALCRCGASASKPFCDGSHAGVDFDGTETASRLSFEEQAETFEGPHYDLLDATELCALARFCDPNGRVWNLVDQTEEPVAREHFLQEVKDCPAGRLVARDLATGEQIEPDLAPSLGLVEDPSARCSGPIWVRGGIPVIGSDGRPYEVRNRVTLCRCGASLNKPFCDGTHAEIGFRADS